MKNWKFLKKLFNNTKKEQEFDLNAQIKQYSKLLVNRYASEFPNLNFSLNSFKDIDKIFEITKKEYKNRKNDKKFIRIEKISAYILYTLKKNYKGEILWNDHIQEPMFMFNNYIEFYPYRYAKGRIETNKKTPLIEIIEKLSQ